MFKVKNKYHEICLILQKQRKWDEKLLTKHHTPHYKNNFRWKKFNSLFLHFSGETKRTLIQSKQESIYYGKMIKHFKCLLYKLIADLAVKTNIGYQITSIHLKCLVNVPNKSVFVYWMIVHKWRHAFVYPLSPWSGFSLLQLMHCPRKTLELSF